MFGDGGRPYMVCRVWREYMVIILKEKTTEDQKNQLVEWFQRQGLKVHESKGEYKTILGLVGDVASVDKDMIEMLDIVDRVTPISEPYKNANRKFHPLDTVIEVGGSKIGGGNFAVIAGPCSVGSEEHIMEAAKSVKAGGAAFLRGGAFKARTSPYSFQGMKEEGLKYLSEAKKATGLPTVSELISVEHLDAFDDVDIIQVGARNMQNYEMLKELGRAAKPVLLTRGLANTMEELLMSAEYIMAGGNSDVILCESGIRTFEPYTRNTIDISAVPVLKEKTHLPVIVDPSFGTGQASLVGPMALAAVAAGADGLMIEVHNDPGLAVADGAQSLTGEQFGDLMEKIAKVRDAVK